MGAFGFAENTQAIYPTEFMANAKMVIFLACDAFGVLPPSKQAQLGILLYMQTNCKVLSACTSFHNQSMTIDAGCWGTSGIKEPGATFSTCFWFALFRG